MKRRFTDANKWDVWFRKLDLKYKSFWYFIHDYCDEVGVWNVDIEEASFYVGAKFTEAELLQVFGNKLHVFDKGCKWWLIDFIELQYKELKLRTPEEYEANPNLRHSPIPRYLKLLQNHGLLALYQNRLNSQLTPSSPSVNPQGQPPVNSHEEEEQEEEVFNREEKKEEKKRRRSVPDSFKTQSIKDLGGAPQSETASHDYFTDKEIEDMPF